MFEDSHAAINGLIDALQERDHYTKDHSDRVAALSANLGMACGLANKEINILRIASLFHDIGKIGVPDHVLLKGDKLTDEEWLQMQQHPIQDERIFKATVLAIAHEAAPVIRHHHEAFGGEGYPDKLQGESIPLLARILTLADAYDAMKTNCPYRKAMEQHQVFTILESEAGKKLDPLILASFIRMIERKATPA